MQTELIELAIAIIAIALVMFVLRRASATSKSRSPQSARERLGYDDEALKPSRKRRRDLEAEATRAAEERARPIPRPTVPEVPPDAETAAAYKAGLEKTRGGFVARLGKLFGKKQIDATTLDELEEVLFSADIGPRAADRIFQAVKKGMTKIDLEDADKIWTQIKQTSREILNVEAPPMDLAAKKPFVLLVLGVNGVGKTTTIGKLASK
ncbi:MAG: signal recognition particle receptor subunit alpha, partial [Kofleriaceae bacterium]